MNEWIMNKRLTLDFMKNININNILEQNVFYYFTLFPDAHFQIHHEPIQKNMIIYHINLLNMII